MKLNENAWLEIIGEDYNKARMSAAVERYYKDTNHPKIKNAKLVAKIMVFPSFETQLRKCYEIYWDSETIIFENRRIVKRIFGVLRMTWDEMKELKKFIKNPNQVYNKPDITHDFKIADFEVVNHIFDRFEQSKIPSWSLKLALDQIIGNDGTIYEVWFGDGFWRSIRYSWWVELPKEWSALDKATHAAMHDIDEILKPSDKPEV